MPPEEDRATTATEREGKWRRNAVLHSVVITDDGSGGTSDVDVSLSRVEHR